MVERLVDAVFVSTDQKQKSDFKLPNRNTWVKSKLRFASLKWPARNECLKLARTERGRYQCADCKMEFKKEQLHVDHIEPVIALDNDELDWNSFIRKLFAEVDELQALCTNCHNVKTALEDSMRSYYAKEKKDAKSRKNDGHKK